MYIIDEKLKERHADNRPIKVGIIGAGEMAKGLINQIHRYTRGIFVAAVYARSADKAADVLDQSGVERFKMCSSIKAFNECVENRITVITTDLSLLLESESIDCIVEMTGQIEFSLDLVISAFRAKKHVVSFNAELEATFGPYIKAEAEKRGVKYSLGDGDQPGVTMNLYRYVKAMGFTPMVCGNVKGMLDFYRTPATQKSFAEKWGMNPVMATNFADGTKVSLEQACTANATGMRVAKRGMLAPVFDRHVDDLVHLFDYDDLTRNGGIVDMVIGAKPGPGVFVYAGANDPISIKYLKYGKLGDGPLYSFYIPYHLLFFELAFSIVRLIDFDDVTLDAQHGMCVEVISLAKTDLPSGTVMDGIGGFHAYGICENSPAARSERLVPIGLIENCVVKRALAKDEPLTLDAVELEKPDLLDIYLGQIP